MNEGINGAINEEEYTIYFAQYTFLVPYLGHRMKPTMKLEKY